MEMDEVMIDLGNFDEYAPYLKKIYESHGSDIERLFYSIRTAVSKRDVTLNTVYKPTNDRVFTLMFLNKELAETVIGTIVGEQVELKDSFTEYDVNTLKAYLSKVRFDVYARSKDDCVFTMDMQRRYFRSRVRNRSVYYDA